MSLSSARAFGSVLLLLALACSVPHLEAAQITVGQHSLRANQPDQWVSVMVSGGDAVSGLDLFAQVGDGGPELTQFGLPGGKAGPRISGADLLQGTIFQGVSDVPTNLSSPQLPQTAFYSLALIASKPTVNAQGTLVRLRLDTTGFYGGQWDLRLQDVLPFATFGGPHHTNFAGPSAIIQDGSISIPIEAGDYNGNRQFDPADVDALGLAIRQNSTEPRYDVNRDGRVNEADQRYWVSSYARRYFGDSNWDGQFNSADLVTVFAAGQYEDAPVRNSLWSSGDWSGDGEFSSSDLVLAFQDGGYELGQHSTVPAASVPEPTVPAILTCVALLHAARRARHPGSSTAARRRSLQG
jgi:hypothetical protein